MTIAENLTKVRENIARAAKDAGLDERDILLIGATKMNDAARVREAIAAGLTACGENRVQELLEKNALGAYEGAQLHFIGHLQRNKVKQVVGKVDLIQSVDSERLLRAINTEAARQGIRQDILLEINIGNEESKSGFRPEEVLPLLAKMGDFSNVCMKGLMAIPPISRFPGENLRYFQKIFQISVDIREKINDNVTVDCLSMGMSDDYMDTIACGSTMIRVGTAIFGARDYSKLSSN